MSGAVSTWALTREVMRETGGEGGLSCGLLGLEGRRPRRPLSESVLTTGKNRDHMLLKRLTKHKKNSENIERMIKDINHLIKD